jgi:hypothetical protein
MYYFKWLKFIVTRFMERRGKSATSVGNYTHMPQRSLIHAYSVQENHLVTNAMCTVTIVHIENEFGP